MVTTSLPGVYRLTYADWLRFPDDGRLYELLDGELSVTPPPSVEHQRISRNLEFVLLQYLREREGGEIFYAPIGVRLSDDDVLEPDLVVVLAAHADRIGSQVIEGTPDLVVEILSPGTARRDLGPKREKYRAASIPEYWIVDAASTTIEVLALEDGQYVRHGLYHRSDVLLSRLLIELRINLQEVFAAR